MHGTAKPICSVANWMHGLVGHGLGKKNYSIDNFLNEEHQKYSIAICCKTYSLLLHMRKPDFILMIILDNFK